MSIKKLIHMLLGCAAFMLAPIAHAEDTIKVGVLAEFSGPFADFGQQISNGIKVYMKEHGDTVAGKKIEVIYKDTTGPAPDIAKRLAQELVTRDQVQFIVGFGLTPNAMAVAPVATEAKVPMIIMNAATSIITTKSPYIARVSMTLPQVTAPIAEWAYKNGIRNVYTLVTDYGPGHDAEATFKKVFTKLGGQIAGEARVPLKNPEYAPFLQRVKDAKPDALFVFIPAGEAAVGVMKAYADRGLAKAGIKLIGPGDVTDDTVLEALGDIALGMVTTHHYSAAHDSPENKAYVKAYADLNGDKLRPNFMSVGGYDGMAAIYEVVKQLNGVIDGDKAMAILKGMKLNSPRGPIMIDPQTRDIVQTVYVRRVEKVNGKLYNVEFDKFPMVKDPGKE
ncbi:MAG TPA: ABC transporter substrate-binding protein [Acidiferrobacterales bacterium]|nr:ABC transporter substrate-binding protein [Acidiferrobacterales bacterium]